MDYSYGYAARAQELCLTQRLDRDYAKLQVFRGGCDVFSQLFSWPFLFCRRMLCCCFIGCIHVYVLRSCSYVVGFLPFVVRTRTFLFGGGGLLLVRTGM